MSLAGSKSQFGGKNQNITLFPTPKLDYNNTNCGSGQYYATLTFYV